MNKHLPPINVLATALLVIALLRGKPSDLSSFEKYYARFATNAQMWYAPLENFIFFILENAICGTLKTASMKKLIKSYDKQ